MEKTEAGMLRIICPLGLLAPLLRPVADRSGKELATCYSLGVHQPQLLAKCGLYVG